MEEVLKDDPLKKPKKITLGFIVVVLAVLMVCAFAAFHWLYADYFAYSANKTEASRHLEEIRARYAEEGEKAKISLAEVEERVKAAEKSSQSRIKGLEEEYATKRKSLQDEFEAKRQALESDLVAKKQDLALLLRGFKERFDSQTNDLETAIQSKCQELAGFQDLRGQCADLLRQYETLSNSMMTARHQRDEALKKERDAQDSYNVLNGKIGIGKSELDQVNAAKTKIAADVELQKKELTKLKETSRMKTVEIEGIEKKLELSKDELSKIEGGVKSANAELAKIREEIADAKTERESVVKEREDIMKRYGDSKVEKAIVEKDLDILRKRKQEMETAVKELERALNKKKDNFEKVTPEIGGSNK